MTEQTTFHEGLGLPGPGARHGHGGMDHGHDARSRLPRKNLGVRGAFAFPIRADRDTEAVLEFFTAAAVAPDPALLAVMAQIGRYLGRVLERIRAQEQIAHQATHDALTGLANRLLFRDRLELALARADRRGFRRAPAARRRPVQGHQRHARARRRRPAPAGGLEAPAGSPAGHRHRGGVRTRGVHAGALRRRRVRRALRGPSLGERRGAGRGGSSWRAHPFVLERNEHVVTASIGIVLGERRHRDAESLLRDADIAITGPSSAVPGTGRSSTTRCATERSNASRRSALASRSNAASCAPLPADRDARRRRRARWRSCAGSPQAGAPPAGRVHPDRGGERPILEIGAWTLNEACEQAHRCGSPRRPGTAAVTST